MVSTGDVTPDGPVSETVVWYGGSPPPPNGDWKSPQLAAAQAVLAELQGPAILGYNPKDVTPGAEVTVQTGTGLSVSAPVTKAPTTTTTLKKHSGTTTTIAPSVTTTTVYVPPGLRGNGLFTTPSSVNPTLEPWDPRACNAAGTGPA